MRSCPFFLSLLLSFNLFSQPLIDDLFEDWTESELINIDETGDVSDNKIDFGKLWASNDDLNFYISFENTKEINLQEGNDISLFVDIDGSILTGQIINGIGADIIYSFGNRNGLFIADDNLIPINHSDIGLITLPTVSSEKFEIAVKRNGEINGHSWNLDGTISFFLEDESVNGDKIPDKNGGIDYTFDNTLVYQAPQFNFKKNNSHLRIISYNSLTNGLFEPGQRDAQRRLIQALDPDIIGFQEIYSFNANEIGDVISSILPLEGGQDWFRAKVSPDISVISKFPITDIEPIAGNGAFKIDLGTKDLLLINAHLPCCENNFERQQEIDEIMSFLRQAKDGSGELTIEPESPIVILGDMNLVGYRRQQETLITGDIFNNVAYGPDIDPDWDGNPLADIRFYNTGMPTSITWYSPGSSFSPGRLDYIVYSSSVMSLENSFCLFSSTLTNNELNELGLNKFDTDNSSDHLPLVADFELGVSSVENTSIDNTNPIVVYPNPVKDFLNIQFNSPDQKVNSIEIYSASGDLIQINKHEGSILDDISIDVSEYKPGTYFLSIKEDFRTHLHRFVKL